MAVVNLQGLADRLAAFEAATESDVGRRVSILLGQGLTAAQKAAARANIGAAARDEVVLKRGRQTVFGDVTFERPVGVPAGSIPQDRVTDLTTDLASKLEAADLAAKADANAVVDLTTAQTVAGVKTFTSAPVVPDGSFTQAKVTNLTTDLAAKAAVEATAIIPTGAPKSTQTIAQAFPTVTLAQVQAVDPAATLADTADWYVLQSFIKAQTDATKRWLKIPPGTYYMSRGLDMTNLPTGTYVYAEGATLNATGAVPSLVVVNATSGSGYTEAWHLYIHGLHLVGNYLTERGFYMNGAQEFILSSVRVYTCVVGIALRDTWYGEISGLSVLQNCLVGLDFMIGEWSEINTINVTNLKINFGANEALFTTVTGPESIGVRFSTDMRTVDFNRVNFEGMEYAVLPVAKVNVRGYQNSVYAFRSCYFENITYSYFDYTRTDAGGSGNLMKDHTVTVSGCRFSHPNLPSIFGYGSFDLIGNQPFSASFLKSSNARPVKGLIDDNVILTQKYEATTSESLDTVVKRVAHPTKRDWTRFSPWGTKTTDGYDDAMVSTIGHASWQLGAPASRLRNGIWANPSKYYPAYNIQSRPIVFNRGVFDEANGPVLLGPDNAWYMLRIDAVGSVVAKKITNTYRLDEHPGCRTAKELHYLAATATIGAKYQCIDLNGVWLTLSAGRVWENVARRIGTSDQLLTAFATVPSDGLVYDVNTGQCSSKYSTIYARYTWWGEVITDERTMGTLAQRPTSPSEGLIYYNTDDSTYTKHVGGAWVAFTANNTA